MGTRQKFAMFVGIAIHRVVDKIGAYATVVYQCVAFPGRAIQGDGFTRPLFAD